MGYTDELKRIPELAATAEALVSYAKSLIPNADFVRKSSGWVCDPNFVAFQVRTRAKKIPFSVYGSRYEFEKHPALPLSIDSYRHSYLKFDLESPRQLGPAAAYTANAARAYAVKHRNPGLAKRI